MSKKMKDVRRVMISQCQDISWEVSESSSDVEEDKKYEKSANIPVSGYLKGGI